MRPSLRACGTKRGQRGGQCDRAGVGAAAAERRDAALAVHALEARDDGHRARIERGPQPVAVYARDARAAVGAVGLDADLVAEEGPRRHARGLQGERGERRRHLLTGRDQGVALAVVGRRRDAAREREEAIRLAGHRGDHDHDVMARGVRARDARGNRPDAVDVGDRGPAELLHDERHRGSRAPRTGAAGAPERGRHDPPENSVSPTPTSTTLGSTSVRARRAPAGAGPSGGLWRRSAASRGRRTRAS
jgi:hypothetical protein